MKIVIDMQGFQSLSNGKRGIGRYTLSLVKSIIKLKDENEIFIVLNENLSESIGLVFEELSGMIPLSNIFIYKTPSGISFVNNDNYGLRKSAEIIREEFISNLNPDLVLLTSLFEGLFDDSVTSIKEYKSDVITGVIVYDLIPFIHSKKYLSNNSVKEWYLEKIEYLKKADFFLSISESTKQECINFLGVSESRIVNISSDADPQFRKVDISEEKINLLKEKYSVSKDILLYTGGIDYRKNIEMLISSYAKVDQKIRQSTQLVIVCSVQDEVKKNLLTIAYQNGLNKDEIIFTGYIPEDELIYFYNISRAFIFPSWHEGFGLPVLEAMRCGIPVITSNRSSLPEVIGLEDALFDPFSEEDIKRSIEKILIDDEFRFKNLKNNEIQVNKFSWDETAKKALTFMRGVKETVGDFVVKKKRLAYFSPFPPEKSGISDYSAELIPYLNNYYEIFLISDNLEGAKSIEWFKSNVCDFDRVLFHVGNSHFHQHMFGLMETIPGVVVLHDFFLSGIIHHMDASGYEEDALLKNIYRSHGYPGVFDFLNKKEIKDVILKYPMNFGVLENSLGIIYHSDYSFELTRKWYGDIPLKMEKIPLLREEAINYDKVLAKKELGISENEFLVCSFGIMAPSKLNHRLLEAWLDSSLASSGRCRLLFVGQNYPAKYGDDITNMIKNHPLGKTVSITGWTETNLFRLYLSAADMAIQLRTSSRGETSATVLDCMNYGIPTIINSNGSMAEIDDDVVWKLLDNFSNEDLIYALETLWLNLDKRNSLANNAKIKINEYHNPSVCAEKYFNAIEGIYKNQYTDLPKISRIINELVVDDDHLISIACSLDDNQYHKRKIKKILIDVTKFVAKSKGYLRDNFDIKILKNIILEPVAGWRVEPVFFDGTKYRYANCFSLKILGLKQVDLFEDVVSYGVGDFFVLNKEDYEKNFNFFDKLIKKGVEVLLSDKISEISVSSIIENKKT